MFRELSMTEQRYHVVLAVVEDGLAVTEAAKKAGVSRQTVHAWLSRYAAYGLEGLADRSHRPATCPHGDRLLRGRCRGGLLEQSFVRGLAAEGAVRTDDIP